MSWQSYVDNLMETKHMSHCGIFGLDGSAWGTSPNFNLPSNVVKSIVAGIADGAKLSDGVTITIGNNTNRYIFVRSDGSMAYLKKGAAGVVGYKSNQAVIIAVHEDNIKGEATVSSVGKVVDYLTKCGY